MTSKIMLLKDFKFYVISILIALALVYFFISLFVIGYEEGTNNSQIASVCYKIIGLLIFSIDFWAEYLKFPDIIAIIFSFLTSAMLLSILVILLKLFYRSIIK